MKCHLPLLLFFLNNQVKSFISTFPLALIDHLGESINKNSGWYQETKPESHQLTRWEGEKPPKSILKNAKQLF